MLIFQDKQQLNDCYGKSSSIIANNCEISTIVKVRNLEQANE
jgi:type IV secretory pathway TraG/TraD family ATPase VirD4